MAVLHLVDFNNDKEQSPEGDCSFFEWREPLFGMIHPRKKAVCDSFRGSKPPPYGYGCDRKKIVVSILRAKSIAKLFESALFNAADIGSGDLHALCDLPLG